MWHVWGKRNTYLKERDHSDYLGLDERIILKYVINKCEGVDWIYLAQYRDRRRIFVNTVMDFANWLVNLFVISYFGSF
jgi:hypothetical protein